MTLSMRQLLFWVGITLVVITGGYYYGRILLYRWKSIQLDQELQINPIRSLGIIMDGNRRWAKAHGFKPWIGHRQGIEPVKAVVRFCIEKNIEQVTLYTWSLENFKRPHEEQTFLFTILAQEIKSKEFEQLCAQGVRIRFIGDSTKFPIQLRDMIREIEEKTIAYTRLTMNLLFCYGGQQEILAAVQRLYDERRLIHNAPQPDITAEELEHALWSTGVQDPDLIIRTGGCVRLSNFLLYKAAYSELYFLDCYWPEVTEHHLIDAALHYVRCKRRFGQ